MAVYLVTWDLNREKPNYATARAAFIKKVDEFKDSVQDRGLDSVRFISTSWTSQQIVDFLHQAMDGNDTLFVTRIPTNDRKGWLSTSTWEWIKKHES